ncbi:MAG: nitroreductase [Planctomycetes bacterium]|nr:nitroreductase [Planctomycetota bacterium]
MHVRDALLGRRTVHAYRPDPVPAGAIERALEAAIHAPNHRLTWPWRFVRVGRQTRERLADLVVRLAAKPGEDAPPEAVARARAKVLNPHELIVVTVRRSGDPLLAREDYASAACAIQNLCLSLWADGIASKWGTGGPSRHPDAYAMFGIDPAVDEIVGFVWVGIGDKIPPRPERPPLAELVRQLP